MYHTVYQVPGIVLLAAVTVTCTVPGTYVDAAEHASSARHYYCSPGISHECVVNTGGIISLRCGRIRYGAAVCRPPMSC